MIIEESSQPGPLQPEEKETRMDNIKESDRIAAMVEFAEKGTDVDKVFLTLRKDFKMVNPPEVSMKDFRDIFHREYGAMVKYPLKRRVAVLGVLEDELVREINEATLLADPGENPKAIREIAQDLDKLQKNPRVMVKHMIETLKGLGVDTSSMEGSAKDLGLV